MFDFLCKIWNQCTNLYNTIYIRFTIKIIKIIQNNCEAIEIQEESKVVENSSSRYIKQCEKFKFAVLNWTNMLFRALVGTLVGFQIISESQPRHDRNVQFIQFKFCNEIQVFGPLLCDFDSIIIGHSSSPITNVLLI